MSKNSEITFSIWKMFVKNEQRGETWLTPTKEFFTNILSESKRVKSKYHSIGKYDGDNYILIVIDSGDIEPRDEYLVDIATADRRENPRKKTEVELTKQVFIYYDFQTDLLYISGVRYKKLFEEILNLKPDKFLIKGLYDDVESFLNLIQTVEEISFKTEDDIFQSLSKKRRALYDLFETNELGDIRLDLKLDGILKTKVWKFIKSLLKEKENYAVSGLLIRGKGESNFEYVYNIDSFIKKITITARKEDNGKFNPSVVLDVLQGDIREIANEQTKQE